MERNKMSTSTYRREEEKIKNGKTISWDSRVGKNYLEASLV
jgi:hypothetical protein